ncbi:conserved Plasmodium protein, unknown function [Plasmodium gallinaceum]|uniref:Uncharacterized protein n=1 Tax=Plasmodium gallinaceum TaxID=5849 RepID=A0A1J1GR97_PLAGA|nr:conserved Plasmodium protein, unknown function [Plasmodium gallinaceum]CRG94818.1 conserved Plasmodium protein, unknown function [Plasmodium gallinaceum]
MKLDTDEIFKNYNHNETIKIIDNLRKEIIKKEDSIKDFLKKKNTSVIKNTIKIKNIYGSVEKIKSNLEEIIVNYNELINDIKNKNSLYFKESYAKELSDSEKNVVKDVWLKKYDNYEFLFNISILNSDYCFVKKKKEELINYDFFYLNNYINNVYFDINKRVSEEDYIFALNQIYTDIFICLKVLQSILKNDKIKETYKNMFKNENCIYCLNSFVKNHKDNFCEIILKLIYSSFFNLTYNNSCKIKTIPKSIIILLIFYNKNNCQTLDIIKNDLFYEIFTLRINLIDKFIQKKSNIKDFNFEKLKNYFKKIINLILNSKYILLLLIHTNNVEFQNKLKGEENKFSLECYYDKYVDNNKNENNYLIEENKKNESSSPFENFNENENKFLEKMKNEIFILQNVCNKNETEIKKIKEYFNYSINSIEEIKNILNKNSIDNFRLLYKSYIECVNKAYKYMINLLQEYYKNKYIMCSDFFKEYTSIRIFYNEIKEKICFKEKYFSTFISNVNSYINDNYLNFILEKVFEIFFFFFFNKSITAVPFFDMKPVNKWKFIIRDIFRNLFYNVSLFYEKKFEIQNYIFYSFVLNSFYFYYEFYNIDLKLIYTEFLRIENFTSKNSKIKKSFQKELSEYFLTNKNVLKEKYFHNDFKRIIKEKIHPLIYSAYKLIIFIDSKEIKETGNVDFLYMYENINWNDFYNIFHAFSNVLKYYNNENDDTDNINSKKRNILLTFFKSFNSGKSEIINPVNNKSDYFSNIINCTSNHISNNNINEMNENMISRNSFNILNNNEDIQKKELSNEENKELYFYINLIRFNSKLSFSKFLNCYENLEKTITLNDDNINKNNYDFHEEKILGEDLQNEPNFCLNDLKSIFFTLVYNIFKISLECFCLEYFENLKSYLDLFLNMLLNNEIKNILCERMNCHLINILIFSNIYIIYIEKLMKTDIYRSIVIFIVKTILQRRIYKIYYNFLNKLKEHYFYEGKKENDKKNLLNTKITELYNIILLDLCFCEQVLDKNTIINKSFYESLILRYNENKKYYIKSCFYFIHIYKEKYNVYSEKKINENNIKKHKLFLKLNQKDKKEKKKLSSYLLKIIIDDILTELNKLDNLNTIIFQKHIRLSAQNIIKNSYLLYYLFVNGSTLNNILNTQKNTNEKLLEIFNFNKVDMINNNFIENNLFNFFL